MGAGIVGLQGGGKLEGVGRHHPIVVIRRGHQGRGVADPGPDVVQGRVALQVVEHRLAVGAGAVVIGPARPGGEGVVAQHVEHPHRRQGDPHQIRPLGHHGPHQQTAVGATSDRQPIGAGVALGLEVLGRRDEIVEHVLLVLLGARQVPGLAVLAAPAQVGHRIDAPQIQPVGYRHAEARGQAHVEAAIAVEDGRVAAIEFQPLAVADDERHPGAVLALVEALLGDVIRWLERRRRGAIEADGAALWLESVEGRRLGIVLEAEVEGGIIVLAVEAADAAKAGQRHLAHPLAFVVELLDPGGGIHHVLGEQIAAAAVHRQHLLALGDEIPPAGRARVGGIHRHQPAVGGVPVGQQVKGAALVVHQAHVRIQIPLHRQQRRVLLAQILHIEAVARGGVRRRDEQEAVIFGDGRPHVAVVLGRDGAEHQPVILLRRAEPVEIDLVLIGPGRQLAAIRLVVARVEEALVAEPADAAELHVLEGRLQRLLALYVHQVDLAPVAAGQRQGVGQDAAIAGEAQLIQRRGAVGAEGIGIEEHLGRLALQLAPQHVLVLQAVVLEEVVVAPLAKRRPLLGVVPGGGQLLLDGGAIRDLRQVTLSHPVLGLDPGLRLGAAIILQPAIGVGHGLAEIVIHLLTLAGDGVVKARIP